MKISDIEVSGRFRKDIGDLTELKKSIKEIGLLHPVVVNKNNKLVSGRRRIEVFKQLGYKEIPETVIDLDNLLRGECDENVIRKDFTPSEKVAIYEAMERISPPGKKLSESDSISKPVRRKRAAKAVGMSTDTLSKAKQVVEAARKEPKKYAKLAEEMDNTGNINRAYKKLKSEREREVNTKLIKDNPPPFPDQKFRTIVLDPPWDWGDEGDVDQLGRAKPTYATMPFEDIMKLPVQNLVEDNAHIYLWITNRSLPKGFKLLEEWGFRYITCITWCKPSFGMGNYFRGQTEHVLFGIKGSLPLLRQDVGTWFEAKRGKKHSSKPSEFYKIVESCSPGPWLEMFGIEKRPGWQVWGAEV